MTNSKKKSGKTNQFSKAKLEGREIKHSLKGKKHPNPFKSHTTESIEKIRQKALESNHRRLRKGMVEYKGIMLDSSWELALAMRLDELQIKWERQNHLLWFESKRYLKNKMNQITT